MSMTMKPPPLAFDSTPAPGACARCEFLEEELQRARRERDELALRLREQADHRPRRRRQTPHLPLRDVSAYTAELRGEPVEDRVPRVPPFDPGVSGFVQRPDQGVDVGAVSKLSEKELDTLPYGLVVLDADGRVVHYNDTESRLAGLPQERVIGRDFFGEIAPCTRIKAFEGRFRELVADPQRVRTQTFDFVFRFPHSDQHVSITMVPARRRGHFNVAMVRRSVSAK